MPNLFSKPGLLRWAPNSSEFGAPPGVLLRADNLETEEPNIIRKRRGSATLYSGLGTLTHSLFTALIDGSRVRLAGVDNKVYANGTDLGVTFDGSGDIQFCSWLGHVFMTRGTTKLKYDGTRVTNWGIPKPGKRLTAEATGQIQAYFSTCNSTESPAWSASEGTITATYPDGSDGTSNGSIELTPAASGRATITRTFGTVTDFWNVQGYSGSETDIIDLLAWFDTPQDVESVTIQFGVSAADVSDPFRDDYYSFTFKIGGANTTAPREEVIVKSVEAIEQRVSEKLVKEAIGSGSGGGGDADVSINLPHDPIEFKPPPPTVAKIVNDIEDVPVQSRNVIDFRPDASYNPGWTHLTVSRGAMTRQGTTTERDWTTVRAVRIVYKAKAASAGKARFDNFQIFGGGDRALTGRFSFLYRLARAVKTPDATYEYIEKSPPSDPSEYVRFRTQRARLTVGSDALAAFDVQANQVWVYMHGGYLDDWYRIATAGASANQTSMGIDEFASSPDGTISAFDRTRFNQFGLSIPGEVAVFSPDDISGLTCWLDAGYVDAAEGNPVQYWPGRKGWTSFTPTDVSSLTGWYKADTGVYSDAGVTLAGSGDTVQQWNDQSGGGRNLSQATGANKPIYRTGIVNSKPVVRFDGADDYLASAALMSTFIGADNGAIFVVFNADTITSDSATPTSNQCVLGDSTADTGIALRTTGLYAYNDDGVMDAALKSGLSANAWTMGVWMHAATSDIGSNNILFSGVNDSSHWSTTTATSGATADRTGFLHLGRSSASANSFDGDIAEVLVFSSMPTPLERLKIERYLANKYDLTYSYGKADTNICARMGLTASQPTYKANWRNGHPAVYFDGVDNFMEIAARFTDIATNSAKTVFVIGERTGTAGAPTGTGSQNNNTIIGSAINQIGGFMLQVFGTAAPYSAHVSNYDGSTDNTTARVMSLNTPYIWTASHDTGAIYQGSNDTRTSSMNTATSGNTSTITRLTTIGGRHSTDTDMFFKGYIAEVLVYNVALTESQRKQVESYLASKYGLTDSIPYGLTAAFSANADTTNDLIITLSADEIAARIGNEVLPAGLFRAPDNIISMDAPYAERLWALADTGLLYFSERREPGMFVYSHAYRAADNTETPYWVRCMGQGVYVGTSKGIKWIYGSGSVDPNTNLPEFTRIALNIADPPNSSTVMVDGNDLIYMSARGPMRLSQNSATPVDIGDVSLLWRGEARHGVSAVNVSGGRFKLANAHSDIYVLTPEGASTTSSSAVWKGTETERGTLWRRFTYPWTFSTIYREYDGTIVGGTTDGKVVQLETGSQDGSTDVSVVCWTPVEDAGFPLNRKDPFDFTLKGDTGNAALTVAFHKDGSASSAASVTAALNGIDTFLDDIDGVGVLRGLQLRMTGSFSTFKLAEFNTAFRPRPQHRVHVDSGYLRKAGEDLVWYRQARVCVCAGSDISLDFYFDDTLYATKNVTVTTDKTTVYEIPLGREYKGKQPRVVIRKKDEASTVADAGFELYWLELRQRSSGNATKLDVRKVFTDLAVPLEREEKDDRR